MFLVVGIMAAGICIGYLFKTKRALLLRVGKLNMCIIYVLLFFMGISVGHNETVMNNLCGLGAQAVVIAFAGTMGSVLLAWLLYRYLFMPRKKEKP